jgi:hypothetical protein
MKRVPAAPLLSKLIFQRAGRARLWAAWTALALGLTLLLLSVMLWWNFRQILQGRVGDDSLGSTFLTISKNVTDATMGQGTAATHFSEAELKALRTAPQVQDVGALTPAAFQVASSIESGELKFYTLLFLESAPDRFMDRAPQDFSWSPGQRTVPIILSRDFLNMYNYVFAPSQGLPQLSENTIKAIGFRLELGSGVAQQSFIASVAGFSDRISSVLVPQAFMDWGNMTFAPDRAVRPSRLIVRAKDPSDEAFAAFLKERNYSTNAEQLRWNRVRAIVQAVSAATGVLAILLIGIGALVFVLFIELTMARARESVRLLLQIGYSPRMMRGFLGRKFLPLVLGAAGTAGMLAALAQLGIALGLTRMDLKAGWLPGWPVWACLGLATMMLTLLVRHSIASAMK